jgi:hypothetical protein
MVSTMPRPLGVTVMPEWFACEGVDAVFDRVEALGASAIATSPYVLEPAPDGAGGREPPIDGGAGRVRPLDRALFGRHALWVRTAPAFVHDAARYAGMRYQPPAATPLTHRYADLLDRVCAVAARRGIEVLLQVMAASPPGYRVQFSGALAADQCLQPDGRLHDERVDRNASLASSHVVAYVSTLVAELAQRYPSVAGFRLDWPEYPPYDFRSALFDFNPAACELMARSGGDPARIAATVSAWARTLRRILHDAAARGQMAATTALQSSPWIDLWHQDGPLTPLFAAKRDAVRLLLRAVRRALDAVPGPRRRLEPQAFPPPFHAISGFPLEDLSGIVDAVGIKLYTMHWPMIARLWATDLVGSAGPGAADAMTSALAQHFGFTDGIVAGNRLVYPEPDQPHPVGAAALRAKLADAQRIAGAVPVIAFAHAYGPLPDVCARFDLAAQSGRPVWLNRYGYMSDAKIAAVAGVWSAAARRVTHA